MKWLGDFQISGPFSFSWKACGIQLLPNGIATWFDERLVEDSFPTGIINAKNKEAGSGGDAGDLAGDYEEDRGEAGAGARGDWRACGARDDPSGGGGGA
jgi:hypothetical protein